MDDLDSGVLEESEAEAQREETVMPWIWGGIGIVLVAAFSAWVVLTPAQHPTRQPPAAAPLVKPLNEHL